MSKFDAFTAFLLKFGIIPPWEVKLLAFKIAYRIAAAGGSSKNPLPPGQSHETWVNKHWEDYVGMAKNAIHINRPRW